MGNWVNKNGWSIAVTHMDNSYLNDVIVLMAVGTGAAPETVLDFVDEAYAEARKRGLVWGVWGWLLKRHTIRLWKKKRTAKKRSSSVNGVRVPWYIQRIISTRIQYCGYCDR